MQVLRAVGREAASRKYDLLSALMAHGLAGDKHRQRLVMRLMALITTRYNWQRDELTMGQREIARLWSVDERTVKRELARLRALGWLDQKQAGARGRVAVYSLGIARILLDSRPEWDLIGPDFVERLSGPAAPLDDKVVPFQRPAPAEMAAGIWGQMQRQLMAEDPGTFGAWFAPLTEISHVAGVVELLAPSRFHASYVMMHYADRLRIAARRALPSIHDVRVLGGQG